MTQAAIKQWIQRVKDKPIPVLPHTIKELQRMCALDDTPLQRIVDFVEQDPGLTVQLLRKCNSKDGHRSRREIVSVQQAIMMVGTRPLSNIASQLPSIQKNLSQSARDQLMRVYCRAYHAGMQAVYWAKLRRDMTPDEVFAATQLHFLGEMVLAMYAPEELLKCFQLRQEKSIASEEAQYISLGFTFDQLSLALAEVWHLPELVIDALHAENANHPRGFGIMLAVQLARSAAIDWYSDKMLEIFKQTSEWLEIPVDDIIRQAHQLAVDVARIPNFESVIQTASLLPRVIVKETGKKMKQAIATDYQADICLMPQVNILKNTLNELKIAISGKEPEEKILRIFLEGIHDGIGLNRVVYARLDKEHRYLQARLVVGADNDPIFSRFSVKLDQPHLFQHLISKSQAVYINDDNRNQYWPMVPAEVQKLIGTNSFMAMSIFANGKLDGVIYADRHTSACQIDKNSYNYFKKLCGTLAQAMELSQRAH